MTERAAFNDILQHEFRGHELPDHERRHIAEHLAALVRIRQAVAVPACEQSSRAVQHGNAEGD